MQYELFSPKQLITLTWWNNSKYRHHDALICDGSIRSGKTLSMSVGFILWSMSSFQNQSFALCGKTIESLRRNVTTPLSKLLEGLFTVTERISKNYIEISASGVTNRYYLFGGRDESSYTLIQGITLAGVLLDEVALMPRSFVEQALARCSVAGSRFWFNCNPEHPFHWFREEWIDKAAEKNALHLHFTMADNYSLSPTIRQRYENMYTGVFYDRYILGRWVKAEGRVYPMFDTVQHVVKGAISPAQAYYISIDYGTVNPFSMGLWGIKGNSATRICEYYFDSRKAGCQKTDEEYYKELEKLAYGKVITCVVVDPSAASFIETIRRHGRYRVQPAINDVEDGIRVVSTLLQGGFLHIHESCKDSLREFGVYSWDPDSKAQDKVLKEYDHAMDDIRYFCNTILRRELRWVDWGQVR